MSTPQKRLTVLFAPLDAVGHVNAAIGIAQVLISAGHQAIFAINITWKDRLKPYGIEEHLLSPDDRPSDIDPAQHWADLFVQGDGLKELTSLDIAKNIRGNLMVQFADEAKRLDVILEGLLDQIKPDVIILDQVFCIPSVILSGIPWIATCSFNPLFFINDDQTPPYMSGYAITGLKSDWKAFRVSVSAAEYPVWKAFNDYVVSRGLPSLPDRRFMIDSNFMNIYGFPKELDYTDIRPLPPNWFQFDNLKRTDNQLKFELPEQLADKPGKLVYFSLGSMGAADVVNMKRLVGILSKSKHRFIVSKGHKHNEYELPDNMWGEKSIPQIQVLSVVDLVITHGGNNTVTETFYFGKPMIVMPLFADQYDNAQRVDERGFGKRLDAYKCSEDELLITIENLLNNKNLTQKMTKIGQRIQSDNSIAKLPEIIETLINKL